jgi:hypothetical protein
VSLNSLSAVQVPLPVVWLLLMSLDAAVASTMGLKTQIQTLSNKLHKTVEGTHHSDAMLAAALARSKVLEDQVNEHAKALCVARIAVARAKRIAQLSVERRNKTV